MKKLALILFVLFAGVASSFAYNNYSIVEIAPDISGATHNNIPIFSNCQIHFHAEIGAANPTTGYIGYIYLRHSNQYLAELNVNSYANVSRDYRDFTLSGYWNVLELEGQGSNCYGWGVVEW